MTELLATLPAPVLIMVIALGLTVESGFLVGVAVPGTAITLAAGVAAHTGVVSLPAAIAGAALGTIAGGQLAYRLGRRRRHLSTPFAGIARLPTRPWPPLRRSMRRHPIPTVLAAQWLASGRLLVPRTAGWSRMSHRRFTAAHSPSAIAWAATLTGSGYAATAATRDHLALALGIAAGAAVLLGLVVLLRHGHRRTPTESGPGPIAEAPSRAPVPQPRRRHPRLLAVTMSALGAAVVVAGCASGPDKTLSDDATVPGVIPQLTVRTAGAIRVEPGAPDAPVSVHRDIRYRADAPPVSVTRREGDALVLDGTCGDDCLVDYRISVPRGTPVDAYTQAGALDVTGTASTRLRSDAGAIAATRSGGPVDASSQAGSVTVSLSRPADVTTRSSASDITVTVPPAQYRVDARDIDRPDVTVPSSPGAPRTVTARTDAGQVRVAGS